MTVDEAVTTVIRETRLKKGISQTEIARQLRTSRMTVWEIETFRAKVRMGAVPKDRPCVGGSTTGTIPARS